MTPHRANPQATRRPRWLCRALVGALLGIAWCSGSAIAADPQAPEIETLELGIGGVFKLGCWTQATVAIRGGDEKLVGVVEATVEDADAVPAATVTPRSRAVGVEPGQVTVARVFVRPGQSGGSVTVRYLVDGKERAKTSFRPSYEAGPGRFRYGRPAASRIVVLVGPEGGVAELVRSDGGGSGDEYDAAAISARIERIDQLPIEWYGYEGIDELVLTTSRPEFYRPLAQNRARVDALVAWIARGGRVTVFCGASAEELFGEKGPLAPLAPGKLSGMAPLRDSQPLESFSESEDLLDSRLLDLRVPLWEEVAGRVLAYGRRNPPGLPLVVRSRQGFGEITFVGLDPESPPLSNWKGRGAFLRRALGWPSRTAADEQLAANAHSGAGYEDLSNQLRSALDQKFADVETAPFGLVALLVVAYIALIGPGDYFLVKHVLKRMELTWITFPLIVVGTSLAAYFLANAYKGDKLRVNQVEIVDVDVAAGEARGTVWTHFFNPRVQRYDLTLAPRFAGAQVEGADRLAGWLGLAGAGMGGMQGSGSALPELRPSYAFAAGLDAISGAPVQEWSTKSITARWYGVVEPGIDAQLGLLDEELLTGSIANRTSLDWSDVLLMHDRWAYRLSRIPAGGSAAIDENQKNSTVKLRLTAATAGDEAAATAAGDGTVPFDPYGTDVARLAKLMMFYDAVGGPAYATALNRYQGFVDLSRLLAGDQAILLVRVADDAGSGWNRGDSPLASDKDRRWVYYRYVIPVERTTD
ncbi:MAG: hypothetical protein KF847_16845 [Pirellulales bacterium]|nr:hypothetical protein [Pirellulales bacterium]